MDHPSTQERPDGVMVDGTPYTVTVQSWQRRNRPVRYAYVLNREGYWPQVGEYRFGSHDSALRAGIAYAEETQRAYDLYVQEFGDDD